jgi:hypothetical protein
MADITDKGGTWREKPPDAGAGVGPLTFLLTDNTYCLIDLLFDDNRLKIM